MTSAQRSTLENADCEVAFDDLTRQLYATDASLYQIEPAAVAFPSSGQQASAIISAAADAGLAVTPRGAGSGLSGGAIGDGLIVDFARHNRHITDLHVEARTVRTGAGVVLDQLNAFLKPHGFCFGPDVATSSRATIGGMIANDSSGARVPVYGTTADHVVSQELVMADGSIHSIGPQHVSLQAQRETIDQLIAAHADQVAEWMPPGLEKRWSGYALARWLRDPGNLNNMLCGSEGTLAAIFSAELKIVPLPREKGLGLVFFASVAEAMQATVELLELKPSAIEHIDRPLFDQTKGQLHFEPARQLLELDTKPCEALLIVEFYDDVAERLALLAAKRLGLRTTICTKPAEMNMVWQMRKAGLSLLTGRKGPAKPVAFIEDAAVRPAQLPAYVAGLESIMKPLDLEVCYYGHAATGLLHVRPVLDLHTRGDLVKYRQVADQVSALVRQFKGSLAAEHGVGMARTEYMAQQVGEELLGVMRQIKQLFDPRNLFNPGKIFSDGRFKIDNHLRVESETALRLPFEPTLAFAFKDESFIGNLEQCNGCGGCRKDAPTMCPTFLATGEEYMSTRGRANAIRATLELRFEDDPLRSEELDAALSNCLSCKACTVECPSNVNLALLKAELMFARHRRDGLGMRERLLSNVDLLGRLGCTMPAIANASLDSKLVRGLMRKTLGLTDQRPLPHYAKERFDRWFQKRPRRNASSVTAVDDRRNGDSTSAEKTGSAVIDRRYRTGDDRGDVILWDDTFVRYHEPHIGIAALKVLEALGFNVTLVRGRKCCGRPAFSQGNLEAAREMARHNLDLIHAENSAAPILFLEPSCYSMFVEDYRELKLPETEAVAGRCHLFEHFVDELLEREPAALQFKNGEANVVIHSHCHAKSLVKTGFMARLANRLPGKHATLLDTGCCGMAGAFGALEKKYDLSLKVAAPLVRQVCAQPPGTIVVASGTSCRHQLEHLTPVRPKHMAELLADAL
ncbi:MAG TPA: FAD-linked oxidase C-terminal domain-containing protein [Chthoniobacterales bacterium]|nr:FAD-linked oxidase C-terminal domain-containing protein [Chthoniobacterales bacterium]